MRRTLALLLAVFLAGCAAAQEGGIGDPTFSSLGNKGYKATFEFEITTPDQYVAIANGVGSSLGAHKVRFVLDQPSLTCMATVAIGKYGVIKQVGPKELPMLSYVPWGTEGQYLKSLSVLPKYIKYLSDRLGPYPFPSFGATVLPREAGKANALMSGSALETTTIPVFGTGDGSSPPILIHELTHQWMGDCVSVTNWGDDIWWVEGFAQYSEWLYTEVEKGKAAYVAEVTKIYDQVSKQSQWLKPGHLTAQEMFGMQSYLGGGLTFFALRQKLGDEKFFQIVQEFIAKHRYGNTSAADWIDIATNVAGEDMKPFFNAWLYGDTIPKLPL